MRVIVLSGGRSAEREISIESARFVSRTLADGGHEVVEVLIGADGSWQIGNSPLTIDTSGDRWVLRRGREAVGFDAVFPVLHGPFGEDGTVQGLCETAGWPCAGADVLASAAGMNKIAFKRLLASAGIPTPRWLEVSRRGPGAREIAAELGLPVFVKPARLGSSVGISRASDLPGLEEAIELACSYDPLVIVEKAVPEPREIEVSVVGDDEGISSSVPGEVEPGRDWYDYEAKYACADSRLRIPAEIDGATASAVRSFAEQAFSLLGGRGYARVDFLMSPSELFLNEINTIPGFTSISMFPKLWEATGVPAPALLDRILRETLSRRQVGLWRK
jgi:D-alanine-D-alanine ligase